MAPLAAQVGGHGLMSFIADMSENGRTRVAWLALALACSVATALHAIARWWTTDDALITFRYVENWVHGHGLVYNLGEPVEGFSSPLFIVLLGGLRAAGVDLFVAANLLGVAAVVGQVCCVLDLTHRATGRLWLGALAGALFASDRMVAVWATGGLETAGYGLLVLLAFRAVVVGATPRRATVLFLLVAAARPEGVALYFVYLAWLAAAPERRAGLLPSLNRFVPVAAALLALRFIVYGDLVPAPVRAKVEGVPTLGAGLSYARALALRLGLGWTPALAAWLPLVGSALWARRRGARWAPVGRAALLVALGGAALCVAMGGDYMTDFRFFHPFVGVTVVALVAALGSVAPVAPRTALACAVIFLAGHVARQLEGSPVAPDAPPAADHQRILAESAAAAATFGRALALFAEPGDALVVDRAGVKGLGHRLRTLDATGLLARASELERDFELRPELDPRTGHRDRLPGHARWPRVSMLAREHVAFIFPRLSPDGPDVPEVTPDSPARHLLYPFLHVTIHVSPGRTLRFFTALDEAALAERARRHGVSLCWRAPFAAARCAGPE
jgi:hypothetical protein